jgi:hypothetical protein
MPGTNDYVQAERRRAIAWKQATATLPAEAKTPGRYLSHDGQEVGPPLEFCLPVEHAALNLLPEVRDAAIALFEELEIPWHHGASGGPGNHLLSSQVQCVNALGQMVGDAERLRLAFGDVVEIDEVLEIEPGRFLTFEYIGAEDLLHEAVDGMRTRGSRCTSVDAAFRHRASDGAVEVVLVEWKYTESYAPRSPEPAKDAVRLRRYETLLSDPDGPVRADLVSFAALAQEPIYQLVRQQILASELERTQAEVADRVRVVHVLPAANAGYRASVHGSELQALGSTLEEVWQRLLRTPARFAHLDSARFLDPAVTSTEYVQRYGEPELA